MSNTISEAWPRVLRSLFSDGYLVKIGEYWTIEYPDPMIVKILDPTHDMVPDKYPWKKEVLEMQYVPELLTDYNPGFVYTYGERLFSGFGLNQYNRILGILKRDRTSRRCIMTTWRPCSDLESNDPPCLDFIDIKLRDILSLISYFRSNDAYGAMPANQYAISRLLYKMGNDLNEETGPIVTISNKLHVYQRDWETCCSIIGRPDLLYNMESKVKAMLESNKRWEA